MRVNKNEEDPTISPWFRVLATTLGLPWFEILGEAWKLGRQLFRGHAQEGLYEVLDYETTLEIYDKEGKTASVRKRQRVRFLQDHIIAYQDQAWGDGEILVNYSCHPGEPVDMYRSDYKTLILISMREEMRKGHVEEIFIEWDMYDGFLRATEQWSTAIQHRTSRLRVNLVFPASRIPNHVSLIEGSNRVHKPVPQDAYYKLPDGRLMVTWETKRPRINETYILDWDW